MQELPQQPPNCEVVISIEDQENASFKVSQDDLSFEVLEKPSLPVTKLQEKDLFNIAHYLYPNYSRGFTWSELPRLIQEILAFIAPNPEMTSKEKQKATIQTLHYIMVSINPLYFPEKATTPFFEELLPPFIDLALVFPQEKKSIQSSRDEPLTEENLSDYANHISSLFSNGFDWKSLSAATRYALTYILSYANLSFENQLDGTYAILENLIALTPHSELPPHFDHKLFMEFLSGHIIYLLT